MSRPFSLECRHALVTGWGSAEGIGFATARLLGRLGARLSITSTTNRIHDRAAHVADLTDPAQAAALAAAAREAKGPVEVLVSNAGMARGALA